MRQGTHVVESPVMEGVQSIDLEGREGGGRGLVLRVSEFGTKVR